MSQLSKKTLEYLAELARLEIIEEKEEKMIKDLQSVLGYFEELKEVDTKNIESMAGGTVEKNVFREDERSDERLASVKVLAGRQATKDKLTEAFSEEENGFLKIPPVFE